MKRMTKAESRLEFFQAIQTIAAKAEWLKKAAATPQAAWQEVAASCAEDANKNNIASRRGTYVINDAPAKSGQVICLYNNNPYADDPDRREEETRLFRIRMREAGIRELGYATYPPSGEELPGYTYAMVLDADESQIGVVNNAMKGAMREASEGGEDASDEDDPKEGPTALEPSAPLPAVKVQAMNAWRMAFRAGTNGPEMWDEYCRPLGVAAIEYGPVDDRDFSPYATEEQLPAVMKAAWSQLKPTQRASLRRFLWEMKEGDVIYVKKGPMIVGKGVITGPYQFDKKGRIQDPNDGAPWQHQRLVSWDPEFTEVRMQLGTQQIATVKPLTAEDVQSIEEAVGQRAPAASLPAEEADQADANDRAAYVPEEVDRRRLVERQIKERRGQQGFRNALRKRYGDQVPSDRLQGAGRA